VPAPVDVRVHYPLGSGRLSLRVGPDWERDLAPRAIRGQRTRFDFRLELDGHAYFKPVIRDGDELRWARGDDLLVVPNGGSKVDVFPHFQTDAKCSACALQTVSSRTGGRAHAVRVFHPPGYHENPFETFPVIYMHDGQNLFFPEEAFGGRTWRIEETLRVLDSMNLIRRVIVVGVHPVDRTEDYTNGGYLDYGRFLVEDVKPWVDANYRTKPGPADTAVMGSSLGGVVSFFLAWQWPEVFGNAACLSSTFGWRDDLLARVESEPGRDIRVYLDSGWPGDNYEVTRSMRHALQRRGFEEGKSLLYLAFPNAAHNEDAWAMRAHIPLQFFFGR